MKLFNISGNVGKNFDGFAGLYLLDEYFDKVETIYYIDDADSQDKYLFRDLDFMKVLGKRIFDVIKEYDVEDVEVITHVNIEAEYYQSEFKDEIKQLIKKYLLGETK